MHSSEPNFTAANIFLLSLTDVASPQDRIELFLLPTACNASRVAQVAHIRPCCEAGDDDPRDGLALTPKVHWALDRHLFALDNDFRWRVSWALCRALYRRIAAYQMLTELLGEPLSLPREARVRPKREAIEWRLVCWTHELVGRRDERGSVAKGPVGKF